MATFAELAKKYADKLIRAAHADSIVATEKQLRTTSYYPTSYVGQALTEIGKEIEALEYNSGDNEGENLSDEDKADLASEIAKRLAYAKPKTIRLMLKEGSNDSLLTMAQQIADMYQAIKDREVKK